MYASATTIFRWSHYRQNLTSHLANTHVLRLLHHPTPSATISNCHCPCTECKTHNHIMSLLGKVIITFTVPYKSSSPPRQCTPPFHRRQVVSAIVSLLQPRYTARPSTFAAFQRRPPRSLQCLRRITKHNLTHSSFSSNIDIQPHTYTFS